MEEQRALATLGRTLFVMSDSMETEFEQKKCLKESLHYYLKSFSVSNKLREQVSSKEIHEMRARLCLNIGLVYEWKNELDQAEKYMEKALISSRYVVIAPLFITAKQLWSIIGHWHTWNTLPSNTFPESYNFYLI